MLFFVRRSLWRRSGRQGAVAGPEPPSERSTLVSQHYAQAPRRPVDRPGNPGFSLPSGRAYPESHSRYALEATNSSRNSRGSGTRRLFRPSFAFPGGAQPCEGGSPGSLATVHLLDVGSLSGRAECPVSDPLQIDIRFFQHPVLHPRGRSLRAACRPRIVIGSGTTPASREGEKIGSLVDHGDRNDPGRAAQLRSRGGKIGSCPFPAGIQGFHVPL